MAALHLCLRSQPWNLDRLPEEIAEVVVEVVGPLAREVALAVLPVVQAAEVVCEDLLTQPCAAPWFSLSRSFSLSRLLCGWQELSADPNCAKITIRRPHLQRDR